jgi:hypothetical protein
MNSKVPEFTSREEEAEFWDTHDVTDYLDELRPVRVRFAPTLSLRSANDEGEEGEPAPWTPELRARLQREAEEMYRRGETLDPDVCP